MMEVMLMKIWESKDSEISKNMFLTNFQARIFLFKRKNQIFLMVLEVGLLTIFLKIELFRIQCSVIYQKLKKDIREHQVKKEKNKEMILICL